MKLYAVNIFARWELENYKLFYKEENAWEYAEKHNKTMCESCKGERMRDSVDGKYDSEDLAFKQAINYLEGLESK